MKRSCAPVLSPALSPAPTRQQETLPESSSPQAGCPAGLGEPRSWQAAAMAPCSSQRNFRHPIGKPCWCPTSMRTRDPDAAEEHPHGPRGPTLPTLHSDILCPPHAKGLGLMPFLHLGSTCSPRQGRIQEIFLHLTLLGHLIFEAQESVLLPVLSLPPRSNFQEVPSLGSRSILRASRGALHPQLGGCKLPELSCSQALPEPAQGLAPTPAHSPDHGQARSRRAPHFPRHVAEARCFFPRKGGLQPGFCFGNHRRRSGSLRANPSSLRLLGSRQETPSLPGSSAERAADTRSAYSQQSPET